MADIAYAPDWINSIGDTWTEGSRNHPGVASIPADPDPIKDQLAKLDEERIKYRVIPASKLQHIANDIAAALRTCDMDRVRRSTTITAGSTG